MYHCVNPPYTQQNFDKFMYLYIIDIQKYCLPRTNPHENQFRYMEKNDSMVNLACTSDELFDEQCGILLVIPRQRNSKTKL